MIADDIKNLIDRLNKGDISKNLTVHILRNVLIEMGALDKKPQKEKETQDVITFEWFWNTYGKKVDTAKCKAKFQKLTEEEAKLIKETLPLYVKSTPDVQFRKNPLTYLNGKIWLDEIKEVKQEVMKRSW